MSLKKVFNPNTKAGSQKSHEPRRLNEALNEYFRSNEPLAVAYRNRLHPDTHLDVDLKLMTREAGRMPVDTYLNGAITHDSEDHFTFIETLPLKVKRNPRLFDGKYITITRRPDGSLRPNFKPVKIDKGFSPYRYALGVFNELLCSLEDLVEE